MTINTTKRPGFPVEQEVDGNFLDSNNSSSSLLTAGGVFTGSWTNAESFSDLVVAVSSDQNGTFSIQFSTDEVNVDSTLTRYYRTDQINAPHRFTITRKFFRVVFTNTSSSSQTFFRLQTHVGSYSNLNTPIDSVLSRDFDSLAVRPTDPDSETVLGLREGINPFLKFGYNEDVSSSGEEVIAHFGGTFTPLSTATTLTVVSSSANDVATTGTGARSLFIQGIDSDRRYQFEFVNLNGTSSVVTSNTWLGVNRIVVFSSGTGQTNEGDISCTATVGGSNQASIPAGTGVTQQAIYHNQDGHIGLIRRVSINVLKLSGGAIPRVNIFINVWNPKITNTVYTVRRFKLDTSVSNDLERTYDIPIKLDPTDVVWLSATSTQNSTAIDAEIDIVEVKQPSTE